MKKFKSRFFALLLVLTMIMPTGIFIEAANNSGSVFEETTNDEYIFNVAFDQGILVPGETVSISGNINNHTLLDLDLFSIIALYDNDGKMIKLASTVQRIDATTLDDISLDLVLPAELEEGSSVKAFLWDACTFKPLTDSFGLKPYEVEIYPTPQKMNIFGDAIKITTSVNLVVEDGIDIATVNYAKEILSNNSIEYTISSELDNDKTNLFIGIHGSDDIVDNYLNDNAISDASMFERSDVFDQHIVSINNDIVPKGVIAVLGKNTDSAFYGLESLDLILQQMNDNIAPCLLLEDYANVQFRGFIEGFYGDPWSTENRKSLMEFGGRFKMNSYIYAPKDEPYHNSKWRELYPEKELADLKELVNTGIETKCNFIWAIHPAMSNGFRFDDANYANDLAVLLAKFEQLYSIGVRQFLLAYDDVSIGNALAIKEKHLKFITDVATWVASKEGTKSLLFCPPNYNKAWVGNSTPYLEMLGDTPANVEIMWTGDSVCGHATKETFQYINPLIKRKAFMWLNWPVSDFKISRLLIGKGEVLKVGNDLMTGIVSNPMQFSEPSKVSLFAVADFTWNTHEFNADKSWEDGFKYIAPNVSEAYFAIANHLSDPSPNGHGMNLLESENIKDDLIKFANDLKLDNPIDATGEKIIAEMNKIYEATETMLIAADEELLKQISPWINSLSNLAKATKYAIRAAMNLKDTNSKDAALNIINASAYLKKSTEYTFKRFNDTVIAETATKRLEPFTRNLILTLQDQISTMLIPNAPVAPTAFTSSGADFSKMLDGSDATFVGLNVIQEPGDYYGVDLGKVMPVKNIRILQGDGGGNNNNIYHNAVVETSSDGIVWTTHYTTGLDSSELSIEVSDLEISARYVRLRLTKLRASGKQDYWIYVREFNVNGFNTPASKESAFYTNVDIFKDKKVIQSNLESKIEIEKGLTLQPNEYIGIDILSIENLFNIKVDAANEGLLLQTSSNAVEWENISLSETSTAKARYVRLFNDGSAPITFDLCELTLSVNKFIEPSVSHNYTGVYSGNLANVFDQNLETKVWFDGMQDVGKYVQVDLGGVVDINDISVVIAETEGDYFREGDLQISIDGITWTTLHHFANGSREVNFPTYSVPHRKLVVNEIDKSARYVRLITTKYQYSWLALNEIIVNEGVKNTDTLSLKYVDDAKLNTAYTPDVNTDSYSYQFSSQVDEISEIHVIQSTLNISDAAVSIRTDSGWKSIGILNEFYNIFDLQNEINVFEIKFTWDSPEKVPTLHEIFTVVK